MIVGIAAIWAFAEATCFFILPDFFLLPAVIARPKLARRLIAAAAAGSLAGSLVIVALARYAPHAVHDVIVALPFTTEAMFQAVQGRTSDVGSVVTQPISGVPAKVWVWTASTAGSPLVVFFGVLMAARILRFTAVALVGELLAATCGDFLRRHARVFLVAYTAVFLIALAGIAELR